MKSNGKVIRIGLLGPSYAGKTSLLNRFLNNQFNSAYERTNSVENYRKCISVDLENSKAWVLTELIDVFGVDHPLLLKEDPYFTQTFNAVLQNQNFASNDSQENFLYQERPLHAVVVVFDLTDKTSFQQAKNLLSCFKEAEKQRTNEFFTEKILVGNKADLSDREVSTAEVQSVQDNFDIKYFRASALCNLNVDKVFGYIVGKVAKNFEFSQTEESHYLSNEELAVKKPRLCGCSGRNPRCVIT